MSILNHNLKEPLKTTLNWDKILKWSGVLMVVVTVVALLTRARSFLILAQVIDVVIIAFLGVLGVVAYIARNAKRKPPTTDDSTE